jgi:transketolase
MRSIPGMVILNPADNVEAVACVRAAYAHQGPVYMRFGRFGVPVFHGEEYSFEIGKGECLRDGSDVAILATGLLVYEAIEAARALADEGIHARVVNLCTIKPLDEEIVLKAAADCRRIITCEEHSIIGGLGEAVCSLLSEKCPTPVRRIGVNDEFGYSGPAAELLKCFGLSAEHIAAVARDFVKA